MRERGGGGGVWKERGRESGGKREGGGREGMDELFALTVEADSKRAGLRYDGDEEGEGKHAGG